MENIVNQLFSYDKLRVKYVNTSIYFILFFVFNHDSSHAYGASGAAVMHVVPSSGLKIAA